MCVEVCLLKLDYLAFRMKKGDWGGGGNKERLKGNRWDKTHSMHNIP